MMPGKIKMKNMNIVVNDDEYITGITEYLDFNQIRYTKKSLWNPDVDQFGRHELPNELIHNNSTLLIMHYGTFINLCTWPTSLTQLIKFCSNDNKIWVWSTMDGLVSSIFHQSTLLGLDKQLTSSCITVFADGILADRHPLTKLCNIQIKTFPYNFFLQVPRIPKSMINKINCSRDFMLTTVKKPRRPHRDILWDQLNAINGLIDCGHTNYGLGEKRIGQQSHQDHWSANYPSMDLYQDSWLEIAPETLYRNGYFITEKTVKPIATKTPFLTVSTRYYLEYLRQQGFQTFGNIIDESYDRQPLVEDRVRLMLEQLQDIIRNGSEAFYKECVSVLEHNQNRLFEIAGCKQYVVDVFIAKQLEQLGIK
jgi:hypothetical protein